MIQLRRLLLAVLIPVTSVLAQGIAPAPVTLHIGDPAPPLTPAAFIKGEPVKQFEKGKTYVLDFWGTACPPCRRLIPHLTELQKQYKDIIFIGQDVWEIDPTLVKPFVDEMGDRMNYRVAIDDTSVSENGKMSAAWMEAAGEPELPVAFLIDRDGKIAYIGHAMALDTVLANYTAGKLDIQAEAHKRDILKAVEKELHVALAMQNFNLAFAYLDQLCKLQPEVAGEYMQLKYSLLIRKRDFPAAITLGHELATSAKDNADIMSLIAWSMVDPQVRFDKPDLDLALQCAKQGEALSNHNPDNIDTLAHVYAAKGDLDQAITLETQALANANDRLKPFLQKSLAEFKAKK